MRPSTYKSALKSLFCFEGYKLCGVLEGKNRLEFCLQKTRTTGDCPVCGRRHQPFIQEFFRTIRDLDMASKQCYLRLAVFQIRCRCGFRGMEQLNFLSKHSRFTDRFVEYVALLCQKMSLKDVSQCMHIDWKSVKNIDKAKLQDLISDINQENPTKIGVDEVAYEKGHKYLTIVRDIDAGKVLWTGKGRKKDTLNQFFQELGLEKSWRITVAVCDMWDPYIASIHANTNAAIVFDKFHIAKYITNAVDQIRCQEFAKADSTERKLMKKKRFLILARQKRLDDKKRETLRDLLAINNNLSAAYILKEQALDIFDETNINTATQRLNKWFSNIKNAGLQPLINAAQTIHKYLYGVLNYFLYRLTNAASEGFNNKINIIKRRAYGYKDLEYFKLKILQACS